MLTTIDTYREDRRLRQADQDKRKMKTQEQQATFKQSANISEFGSRKRKTITKIKQNTTESDNQSSSAASKASTEDEQKSKKKKSKKLSKVQLSFGEYDE